ncbi:ABC transporter ATP-binding protein [Clostridium algidicarnis]|uniref:ABC transporter ATP-binding protein n=1 Tax=Clostridium algidicarnis TaxID=37659 RepID=A0ABS6C434_9CLOT|nr:ABC transporter ATP-binding protein [Clostridium algidicarnis]MBB6630370.1 ABC transporter ATP-binding protein [Clostridium algidicarnis]MBB6696490.1 ABC transporter ATP-binding protein [Clostridium algidicarnis]MBU3202880.1 ABC transporter ATP-binding protein [Clostridium algidicarnis]MBU3205817.1 ABC transporter ATP-binding protein [Clostridium algidicarnis]MBU3211034.1 ABC transporter ATP-binding protein [Clostridium algidicarnis]
MMIISIKNLEKSYKDFKAVDIQELNIKEGEIFGLLGPNGAGKTTTISVLSGIYTKFTGDVKIFDKDVKKDSLEIKKNMGVVPQDLALVDDLTAYENVTFFARLYGLKGEKLKASVKETLEFVGLWDRKSDFPTKFSGGMKRRLNIACAIVHKPRLIIMDEPTVGIDPQSRNNILETVKKLNEQGSTIIYTSHYMEEVEAICTDICIMDNGKIIARGSKEELKSLVSKEDGSNITLEEVFLDLTGKKLRD